MGLCPFHNERTPSFSVNAEKQIFHCFGCGAGGNVISFVMRIENFDFAEAIKMLAGRVHFMLPQERQSDFAKNQIQKREQVAAINKAAARFFYDTLQTDTQTAQNARAYLDKRGVPMGLRKRFGLGLNPDSWDGLLSFLTGQGHTARDIFAAGLVSTKDQSHYYDKFKGRLMFPILDAQDRVAGFGGRIMGGEEGAKYLNSPETPLFDKSRILYGWPLAKKARAKEIILVEGYMDVIGLHRAGFVNSAGVLGTALSEHHARLLKRSGTESVILLMDSDEAGTNAALRAIPILLEGGLKVRVLQVTDAKDPDEYILKHGSEAFAQLVSQAASHASFRVGLLRKKYDLRITEQRVSFTQEAAGILASLSSEIETDAYISETAQTTGISPDAIRQEVVKKKAGQPPAPLRRSFAPAKRTQPSEKGIREARKGLVNLVLAMPDACRALKASGYVIPEEIGDETASKLLSLAFEYMDTGKALLPADAIARFESIEEQQQAAEIINANHSYATREDAEKALNDMAAVVKRAWFDARMQKYLAEGDTNAVNSVFESKRNMASLYITITDG
jgi:DNA primase